MGIEQPGPALCGVADGKWTGAVGAGACGERGEGLAVGAPQGAGEVDAFEGGAQNFGRGVRGEQRVLVDGKAVGGSQGREGVKAAGGRAAIQDAQLDSGEGVDEPPRPVPG